MPIANYTPHTIDVVDQSDTVIRSYASQGVARVKTTSVVIGEVDGVSIVKTVFGDVEGLPEPDGVTTFVVSMVVAQAANREDVVGPDSGPTALRFTDGPRKGQIIGVRAFTRY